MDFNTSRRLLLNEIHRSEGMDVTMAVVSLVKALEYYQHKPFWFNEKSWTWIMEVGRQAYPGQEKAVADLDTPGLPPGDMEIPKSVQIQVGQHWYKPMAQVDISDIRGWDYSTMPLGYPAFFAYWAREWLFHPRPVDAFPCRVDYTAELVVPNYRYTAAGQWSITDEFGNDLPPTWSNALLDNAEPMVRAWAKKDLYESYFNDTENAAIANLVLADRERTIRAKTNSRQEGRVSVRPTPI